MNKAAATGMIWRMAGVGAVVWLLGTAPALAQTLGQASGAPIAWWRVVGATLLCLVLGVAGVLALKARSDGARQSLAAFDLRALFTCASSPAEDERLRVVQTVRLGHQVEVSLLAYDDETVLIATFQRLSLLRPEAARYARLAPKLAQVFAIGVPDVQLDPIPGVTILPLEPGWPLAQEWVVIASGPRCCAALLSRDAEGFRLDRRSRRFSGRWTTEPAEVVVETKRNVLERANHLRDGRAEHEPLVEDVNLRFRDGDDVAVQPGDRFGHGRPTEG